MYVDYDEISKKYDLNRKADISKICRIVNDADIVPSSKVVDFGCGTGNFTHAFWELTKASIIGVEPSDGMREKAIAKGKDVTFLKGDHNKLPLDKECIDLIYMTDVIHHVPDIFQMFKEFKRVLKIGGKVCILTESYQQLESRFWVKYFPTTVDVEKKRYPDISTIIDTAEKSGLSLLRIDNTDNLESHCISADFLDLVKNKGFSMFDLISDDDFINGLSQLEHDYENEVVLNYTHGETFLWLIKSN